MYMGKIVYASYSHHPNHKNIKRWYVFFESLMFIMILTGVVYWTQHLAGKYWYKEDSWLGNGSDIYFLGKLGLLLAIVCVTIE